AAHSEAAREGKPCAADLRAEPCFRAQLHRAGFPDRQWTYRLRRQLDRVRRGPDAEGEVSGGLKRLSMATATSRPAWTLRFAEGEREARRASGEWTGETLADAARKRAASQPNTVAVVGENGGMTYAELLQQGAALARGMLEIGLERGDTVS